ncbi:MAG: SLBB domain-containing protein [Pseudomonadota bacterium]
MAIAPPPPLRRIEFQDLAFSSLNKDLPLFGYDLFESPSNGFVASGQVQVPADYVVGPGDELVVNVWGAVDLDYRGVVGRNGTLFLPKVGSISVAGVRQDQLVQHLRTAIGRFYKNFEVSASLGELRAMRVFVVGFARQPGTYTVSSLSTLVTALFASGGPDAHGSLREIQLKRNGRLISTLDLYDFLVRGDKGKDVPLQADDVIYIPAAGPRVAISGSVNAPAIFEIKAGETLASLIQYTGGLASTANGQRVSVERIIDRNVRQVQETTLDAAGLSKPLKDGDVVQVYALSPQLVDTVTVRGNVAQTLRLPWRPGMRISDVIPSREFLVSPEYWLTKNATGRYSNWLRGKREDAVAGSEARLLEQFRASANDINWDYALVERTDPKDLSAQLLPFNLKKAVLEHDPAENLSLKAGDVVTILSQKDVQLPIHRQTRYIRLEGEVQRPGIYQIAPGESLREVIKRAGGFTPQAYLFGTGLYRESTRKLQQQSLDQALDRFERLIEQNAIVSSQTVVSPEEAQALRPQLEAQRAFAQRLRQVKAEGRIVIQIPPDASKPDDLPNIALEDGDRLYFPPTPSVVNVLGEVYTQNAFLYRPDHRLAEYLDQAGGPTGEGDKGSIYVLKADGSVVAKQQRGWLFNSFANTEILPGDSIVVPAKLDRTSFTKELKDWSQVIYQMAMGVVGLKVLKDL